MHNGHAPIEQGPMIHPPRIEVGQPIITLQAPMNEVDAVRSLLLPFAVTWTGQPLSEDQYHKYELVRRFLTRTEAQLPTGLGPTYREVLTKLGDLNHACAMERTDDILRFTAWFTMARIDVIYHTDTRRYTLAAAHI